MEEPLNEVDYLKQYDVKAYTQVSIATDVVCFSILEQKENNYRKLSQKKLSVLLIKRGEYPDKGKWALPGGFLKENETLEQTAQRELYEETGVKEAYMEQLYSFSEPHRDPRTRVVSVSYLALLNKTPILKATTDAVEARWFEMNYEDSDQGNTHLALVSGNEKLMIDLKALNQKHSQIAFDHGKMIAFALERLRGKIEYTPIAMYLLPKQFTLSALQQVYEVILNRSLLVANFRRKIKDLVKETEYYAECGGHRPSKLYQRRDDQDE